MIHLRLLGGAELSARDSDCERRLTLPPKPFALLAFLAIAKAEDRPVRRDMLLALFWPELSSTRARAALRQSLFQLRRGLGESAIDAAREVISLSLAVISCDLVAFESCLARGDRAGAMELYRGPLLHGFFIDGASSELEGWLERASARVACKAFLACSALADELSRSGNGIAAAQWARRAVSLAPDNEIAVRRLIEILDAFGDRAGALRAGSDFARHLSEEFGSAPSAETQALITAVRTRDPLTIADEQPADSISNPLIAATTNFPAASGPRRDLEHPTTRSMVWRQRAVLAAALLIAVSTGDLVAAGGGATPDGATVAGGTSPPITIATPGARRLYAEGTKRYFAGDARESARLFTAALADDSTCAMCAYYAAEAYRNFDDAAAGRMLEVAMRLAGRVSEPERLLIHYRWADAINSVRRSAVADSLVTRYSSWPDAQMAAAEAATMDGDLIEAAAHLRRAIAAQPLPDSAAGDPCPVCTAQILLIAVYKAADSLPAALRLARQLVRFRPHSRLAWLALSHVLSESGQFYEARAAIDTSTRYASGTDDDVIEHAQIEIRAGNYAVADHLLTALVQTGNDNSRFDALWFLVISLRAQGRLHEALAIAEGPMRRGETSSTQGIGESELAEAQVRFELGQYRRAAEIFQHQAVPPDAFARAALGRVARQRVWTLTHAGSALGAAGDTIALSALVDTVDRWGAKSGFGRDRRIHYYLRGLLWLARGRPDSAVTAFRSAKLSETEGFSRLDLQLARSLMAVGRPRDAIPVLEHPLGGTLEGGNFYVSRTELQETLAHAWDAAGEPDSAAVYYRAVLHAWRHADTQFQPAIERYRARLAADRRLFAFRR